MVLIGCRLENSPLPLKAMVAATEGLIHAKRELAPADRLELAKPIGRKRERNSLLTRRRQRKGERITDARFRLNSLFGGALRLKRKRSVVESGGQLQQSPGPLDLRAVAVLHGVHLISCALKKSRRANS